MDDIIHTVVGKYNYWIYITLMMIGFYAIIAKNNLVKKIIGVNIFQTAIILFYVSIGCKVGGYDSDFATRTRRRGCRCSNPCGTGR